MGADLEGARLDLLGERLLLRFIGGARELVAQLGQPNQDFSPSAPTAGLVSGFQMSGATQAVKNMFQPPCAGGSFFARRVTTVFQSIACRSTLKPACRSSCAATSGSFWIAARSVGFMRTTGVPS